MFIKTPLPAGHSPKQWWFLTQRLQHKPKQDLGLRFSYWKRTALHPPIAKWYSPSTKMNSSLNLFIVIFLQNIYKIFISTYCFIYMVSYTSAEVIPIQLTFITIIYCTTTNTFCFYNCFNRFIDKYCRIYNFFIKKVHYYIVYISY